MLSSWYYQHSFQCLSNQIDWILVHSYSCSRYLAIHSTFVFNGAFIMSRWVGDWWTKMKKWRGKMEKKFLIDSSLPNDSKISRNFVSSNISSNSMVEMKKVWSNFDHFSTNCKAIHILVIRYIFTTRRKKTETRVRSLNFSIEWFSILLLNFNFGK